MRVNLTHGAIDLAQGKLVSLDGAGGWTLVVSRGSVWVTSPALPGDHFLKRGDSLHLRGNARVVVEALSTSAISLEHARQARPAAAAQPSGRTGFSAVPA
ncbi:DUF2917 domain-containing protein [Niveibacterium sp. 24ML]|uniref:DUF2917 domain-containing protein n=1 Tax=Niveibacterium sp. 24ML TaxID=2985512 RepID=UPI00227084D9|nr:DUF2917 domain-containing protein [Niveibacterium sp. 24ML]MCX9158420.1 DUF2917 domain-containing protein [Niveibacterium sp. 24ML]